MTDPTPPKCPAKHTKYNPTQEEFKCPECGAPVGCFVVDEPAEDALDTCAKLHADDVLHCYKCGYKISAPRFVSRIVKEKNLVPCPTCKGRGVVKGSP